MPGTRRRQRRPAARRCRPGGRWGGAAAWGPGLGGENRAVAAHSMVGFRAPVVGRPLAVAERE